MQIHFEQASGYRCQDCRETSVVFILARESELRLCRSCFEKFRDLSSKAPAVAATAVTDYVLRVKSDLSRNRAVRLRLTSRGG